MKYYKIHFYNGEVLYVTASSMHRVQLWVLQHCPMEDYYLINIIRVNPDKTTYQPGEFMCLATREYYHSDEAYGNISDEEIRREEIAYCKRKLS